MAALDPMDASTSRPLEVEDAPRRAASADFGTQNSSDGDMRDALDPANQSLGEALKLSYRILQLGVLALVVTFLFSGFQSVEEGPIPSVTSSPLNRAAPFVLKQSSGPQ